MAPGDAAAWCERARRLRAAQDMPGALAAITRAAALDPGDGLIALLRAQTAYELGYPAAGLYAEAQRLAPGNPDVLRNRALALASEGEEQAAQALLAAALAERPEWLDGQRVLAALRFTSGEREHFDAGFAAAVRARPRHQGLWLGWFGAIAQQREWPRAEAILDAAAAQLGETRSFAIARAFVASESGRLDEALARLAALDGARDGFLDLCRIRTLLRAGRPDDASVLALPLTQTPLAGQVWPYLSTCWRLCGDARADWLDGDPLRHADLDLGFSEAELAELAGLLRGLHTARAPYPEQTARGGTQTDRSVLLRHEPALQAARRRLLDGVRSFVAGLAPADPRHPTLSRRRDDLQISGSWSVRLGAGGYNVAHSHPLGWLSAVFYVALPADPGPMPAGALQLGAPPAELGLDLGPCVTIAPRAGRLVVFPSILWHATVPIAAGERLNIAFDVVPAQG
ncbi:MAG: hypothetical protein KGK11_03420 [Sphingomonadales bacterium]|nr:hypothetical protein [Sphingomonadales bacterium]